MSTSSLADLPLALDRARQRQPLAHQLVEQLRHAAASGYVRLGDRLPSTRALAASLGVSRTVTAAAYEQLYAEGWIEARHGAGTFLVAVPAGAVRHERGRGPVRAADGSSDAVVDLRTGVPWAAGLRPDVWRRAWRRAGDADADSRPVRAGLPAFRTAVGEHLLRHRGLTAEPDGVLATGGTTAAVLELASTVLRPGDIVAVEEPGYPRAVHAFRSRGVRVVPAPVDRDGLVVDRIPAGVRAVYCTPAHQFPLGGRLTAGRRVDLVRWARERHAWVLEDDYDGELRYDVAPLPLLAALGPDVVVHLGTASKILTPTLGTGWLVGSPEVVAAVAAHREATGTSPATAGQRLVTALADSGDLARHLRRLRRELASRRDEVVTALSSAGLAVLGDKAGAHVVVLLPDAAAERRAVAGSRRSGLLLDGLARCFAGPASVTGVTVGYAAPPSRADVVAALPALVALLTGSTRG